MSTAVSVTFQFPADAGLSPLTPEPFTMEQLRAVDVQDTSLIAGKLRHDERYGSHSEMAESDTPPADVTTMETLREQPNATSVNCTISAEIGDGQYMTPSLCEFLCSYVRTGDAVCPHDAELHDCMMGTCLYMLLLRAA